MIKINNIKISVIVPIYDNNFKDCLNSLLNQTLNEIEIICIDYLSDGYLKKCYKNTDLKIIKKEELINLKDLINGEYVNFININNFYMLTAIDLLYNHIISCDCDLLVYPSFFLTEEKEYSCNDYICNNFKSNTVLSKKDIINVLFHMYHDASNLILKSSFLKERNINFSLINSSDFIYLFFKFILISDSIGIYKNPIAFKKISKNFECSHFSILTNESCKYPFVNEYNFDKLDTKFHINLKNIIKIFDDYHLFKLYSRELLNYICHFLKREYCHSKDKEKSFIFIKDFFKDLGYYHVDFVLNLEVDNLFFYRTVLKSKACYDFELYYKIQKINIDNETLKFVINELDNIKAINSNKDLFRNNKYDNKFKRLQEKIRYLTLKNKKLEDNNKNLNKNLNSKKYNIVTAPA